MNNISQYLILILVALSLSAGAQPSPLIESFTIKPSICVIEQGSICRQHILFQWQLSKEGNSCLYKAGIQQPLYCNVGQMYSSVTLMLTVEKENDFILRTTEPNRQELHQQLNIRELGKDIRQSRKHLWSVF